MKALLKIWDAGTVFVLFIVIGMTAWGQNLNCQTKNCTVVGFQPDAQNRNTLCIYNKNQKGDEISKAYSWKYADFLYGQDSQKGSPGMPVQGHYFLVTCKSDCPQRPFPSSGTVVEYLSKDPINIGFDTQCMFSK